MCNCIAKMPLLIYYCPKDDYLQKMDLVWRTHWRRLGEPVWVVHCSNLFERQLVEMQVSNFLGNNKIKNCEYSDEYTCTRVSVFFGDFLRKFVLAKVATSSIRVNCRLRINLICTHQAAPGSLSGRG